MTNLLQAVLILPYRKEKLCQLATFYATMSLMDETWVTVDNKQIEKEFTFPDFVAAIDFIDRLAKIAEAEDHHPDIYLHDWNKVKITLSTHATGGLSDKDFTLATKIDDLFVLLNATNRAGR